jgi:membrane associated rhomboid family serine protease
MTTSSKSFWRCLGAVVAALLGMAFFFIIIGVFGLAAAITGLVLFVALALLIFRRSQDQRIRP